MTDDYSGLFSRREAAREAAFSSIWRDDLDNVFSEIFESYDSANHYASLFLWDKLRRDFVNSIRLESGYKVLDLCAGTNAVGMDLLARNPDIEVTAMERNAPMLRLGTQKADNQGLVIAPVIGDAHDLPFPDSYFDVVTIQWSTRHLLVARAFTEVRRVLKPGGCLYIQDLMRPQSRIIETAYRWFLTGSLWVVSRLFRVGPSALKCRSYFTEAIRQFYSVDEFSALLEELGFVGVTGKSLLSGTVGTNKACK